ncbi:MAG: hypothetical protein PHX25_02950 [Candidatus Pacebacteria bacterium]|nr:hypothetical protein [Candidatus Paceibacterota bacterium]
MKIDLKNIDIPDFLRIKNFSFNSFYGWVFLVVIFSFIILILLGYSMFFYFKIDAGEAFNFRTEEILKDNFEKINKSELMKIISSFDAKQIEFESLLEEGPSKIIDPSI